jgi:hypothetical protein
MSVRISRRSLSRSAFRLGAAGYVELLRSNLAPATAGARSLRILEKFRFRKAKDLAAGDDQLIEYANPDKLQWLTSRVMIASRNVGSAAYFHSKLSAKRK